MSIKSNARKLGRMIRKVTGLDLPVAMKLGKMVAQFKSNGEMVNRFPGIVQHQKDFCDCCGPMIEIVGKRGTIIGWAITESVIAQGVKEKAAQ